MIRTLVSEASGAASSIAPAPAAGGASGGGPASTPRPGSTRSRRRLLVPILLQLAAMVGIGALVYPSAADWFATLTHDSEISGYTEQLAALPDAERRAGLEAARAYNANLPQGVLRDPYTDSADAAEEDAAYRAYEEVLRVGDGDVIGELDYPRLGIGLPIYHGTADETISKGVGHLYGSSLPIGGVSTHAALTSHSGLVTASLFTPLTGARAGDEFQISVLGETHHYRVESVETVLPDETEKLRIIPGEDRVTLITCTPIGINSHRLLVHGVRVPGPEGETGVRAIAGDGRSAGFPWWAVVFAGGSGATAVLLFAPPRGVGRRAARGAGRRAARNGGRA